jgi:hypothetical protein
MRCDECRFFNLYFEDDKNGECRRKAPIVRQENIYARWPNINRDKWCGEYQPKKEDQ